MAFRVKIGIKPNKKRQKTEFTFCVKESKAHMICVIPFFFGDVGKYILNALRAFLVDK